MVGLDIKTIKRKKQCRPGKATPHCRPRNAHLRLKHGVFNDHRPKVGTVLLKQYEKYTSHHEEEAVVVGDFDSFV